MLSKFSMKIVVAACATLMFLAGCVESTDDEVAVDLVEQDLKVAEENWRQPLFSGLGGVNFPITTTSPVAQNYFNQGLALSYAFNHAAADFAFTEATIYDPDCAMCYWGSALVLGPNVNAAMVPGNAPRAFGLAQSAKRLSENVSAKEQQLIEALLQRYTATEPADRNTLNEDYANGMRAVMKAHPEDAHIAALAAESMMDVHPWDFWDAQGQTRAWTTEITDTIEAALALDSKHIGAIHLYIHAVEQSSTPERAESYADTLADLAPAAGHLVHMPAHIYMRVGRYHDATLNNILATASDNEFIQACRSNSPIYLAGYIPHNWHFGWVTAAISGWKSKAYELADGTAAALTEELLRAPGMGVAQHFLVQPLYARVRFSDWPAILAAPAPDDDLLYARGVWHYARGQAFVGLNETEKAKQELSSLSIIRNMPELQTLNFFKRKGAPVLLEIAETVLTGSISANEGQLKNAISTLEAAVAMEDALPYSEPPEWFFPVRHALGAVQISAGDFEAAEATYRRDLEKMVENGWALRGLVKALTLQGETEAAQTVQHRFEAAWSNAEIEIAGSVISSD
ncbi:MAG: tetratricopeptide (TPR) repeat protein [Patiriisocius sp.]|jgi:tetratricopeptide (TPR) repeat protein